MAVVGPESLSLVALLWARSLPFKVAREFIALVLEILWAGMALALTRRASSYVVVLAGGEIRLGFAEIRTMR